MGPELALDEAFLRLGLVAVLAARARGHRRRAPQPVAGCSKQSRRLELELETRRLTVWLAARESQLSKVLDDVISAPTVRRARMGA